MDLSVDHVKVIWLILSLDKEKVLTLADHSDAFIYTVSCGRSYVKTVISQSCKYQSQIDLVRFQIIFIDWIKDSVECDHPESLTEFFDDKKPRVLFDIVAFWINIFKVFYDCLESIINSSRGYLVIACFRQ